MTTTGMKRSNTNMKSKTKNGTIRSGKTTTGAKGNNTSMKSKSMNGTIKSGKTNNSILAASRLYPTIPTTRITRASTRARAIAWVGAKVLAKPKVSPKTAVD